MRIYDPRLGKFLSVDPIAMDYPWYSPYHFAGNSPIMSIDLDGAEPQGFMEYWDKKTEGTDHWGQNVQDVYDYQTNQVWSVMREPNSTRVYYWQRYDNAHSNWDNSDHRNNFDQANDQWKGKWVEFKPRHASEMDKQFAKAYSTAFVGAMTLITGGMFVDGVVGFAVSLAPEAEFLALRLLNQGNNLYLKYAVSVGGLGMKAAEFLDETGTIGAANSGVLPFNVSEFVLKNADRIYTKLGAKVGQGRLPYERSAEGVNEAFTTVRETLENITSISDIIPKSKVRGSYDLIHIYSERTKSTVSLRILEDGSYEFDTLIPEKSSKIK